MSIIMWQKCLCLLVCCFGVYADYPLPSPPWFTKQPPNGEILFQVAADSTQQDIPIIINCEAEGEPQPTYQWLKNGKLFNWQMYDDYMTMEPGSGTLVITKPRESDVGHYQCFATNKFGSATSQSVFVRKAVLNSFKEEVSESFTANEGKPFKLPCQPPYGWPKPIVHWVKMNEQNQSTKVIDDSRFTVDPEGNLWISYVNILDRSYSSDGILYFYVCVATSPFTNEYKLGKRILLDVLKEDVLVLTEYPVTIQYLPENNHVVPIGQRLELVCIFGGYPIPYINWGKDYLGIQWNDRVKLGNHNKSLIIDSVQSTDVGEYSCLATNTLPRNYVHVMNVEIVALPSFTNEPKPVIADEDEDAIFHCEAQGNPEPDIKWIFNGRPIEEATVNNRRTVTSKSITITDLKRSDMGNYGCNASNSLGYVYRDAYLKVVALPPTMEQGPGTKTTVVGQNVSLVCKLLGSPKPIIKWTEDGTDVFRDGIKVSHDGGILEITDITLADAGIYRCIASNKFGSVRSMGTLIVEPAKINKPAENPITLRTFHVDGEEQIIFDWTIGSDDNENERLNGYKIYIWAASNPEQKYEFKIKNLINSYRINSLNRGTKYFAYVVANNGITNGPPSNMVSFTTPEY